MLIPVMKPVMAEAQRLGQTKSNEDSQLTTLEVRYENTRTTPCCIDSKRTVSLGQTCMLFMRAICIPGGDRFRVTKNGQSALALDLLELLGERFACLHVPSKAFRCGRACLVALDGEAPQ